MMLSVLDLFSGIGGFSLGLKRTGGFRTVLYVEQDQKCQEAIGEHARQGRMDMAPIWDDVSTLPKDAPIGRVDVVTAGWPCQGNSIAGKREGMQDERSGLWGEVVRILRDFRPQCFLGENVPGLFSVAGGCDFLQVLRDLDDLGYGVSWRVLDAQFFGVPQRRRRVFLVGHLGRPCPPEILFEPEGCGGDSAKGRKAGKDVAFSLRANPSRSGDKGDGGINTTMIAETLNSGGNSGGFRTEPGAHLVARPLKSGGNDRHDESHENYIVSQAMSAKWAKGSSGPAGDEHHNLVAASLTSGGHPNSNAPGRRQEDDVNLVAPTLRSNQYNNSDPAQECRQLVQGVRRLTPTECERLQGFPNGWTGGFPDSTRYKMLGNAVAVPVIEWIGRRILESAEGSTD